ncbi:MAG: hypothetical protein ABR911_01580 [Syntrophales bacterium]
MDLIGFPIKMSEISKMQKDGDKVGLSFSYACIVCMTLFLISLSLYWLNELDLFKTSSLILLPSTGICLLIVYLWRPYFLSDTARYRRLDNLEGLAYEDALEKMADDDRERYLSKTKGGYINVDRKISPLEIIFDPQNLSGRFWSMVSMEGVAAWQYRVEIKNNSLKTLKNVSVTTEHIGQMPILPTDKVFTKTRKTSCDLKPKCSELVAVLHWPIPKKQPGMLSGKTALEYGPIRITAAADDALPTVKIFDFDYQTDQMLFERKQY